jgi:hypothetical protein
MEAHPQTGKHAERAGSSLNRLAIAYPFAFLANR